jgi:hypothetical protein
MGIISFFKDTPGALKQTASDIKNSPLEGVIKGTGRVWGRFVSNVKTIGSDVKR